MTTIAFDGKTLAVDCASWKNSYTWTKVKKLFVLEICEQACLDLMLCPEMNKIAWACAGDAADVPLIYKWLVGGDRPILEDKTISRGLFLSCNGGEIYSLTSRLTLEEFQDRIVADGGGFEMALGAMLAGADAVQAINLVASRSSWSAGGVDSYTLNE